MLEEGHDVTAFFYNPNIHPYQEYKNRLVSVEKYAELKGTRVIYDNDYDIENYLRGALVAEERCEFCYKERLEKTARIAGQLDFDAFTTTLLISPYQKHETIVMVGKKIANEFGIEFYYEDFREGYQESRDISKTLGLYKQKYCGCIFSEKERYFRKKLQF
jgi:predicted adenine nucleotide alpha hydrolase (AANH) superfamily ATPase